MKILYSLCLFLLMPLLVESQAVIGVQNGGTGASTAPAAITNLGGQLLGPPVAGVNALGDSICNNTGSTVNSLSFVSLFMNQVGGTLNNLCVSGQYIQDEPIDLFNSGIFPTVANNPIELEEGGKNDVVHIKQVKEYC